MLNLSVSTHLLAALIAFSGVAVAQENALSNRQNGQYLVDRGFFQFPADSAIGSTPSIEVSPGGTSIWVVDRCGGDNCVGSSRHPVMEFDLSGTLLRHFGSNMFVRPHGLHVDHSGNVWVTDGEGPDGVDQRRAGKGHQVFKFTPQGELIMTLGTAGVAGNGENEFNQPSDVVVAENGDIFIADGHGGDSNARIVKYSSDGTFIKSWGKAGKGTGDFASPHTIAMDSRGRLFVGDRGNNLIQIFNQEGTFLEQWSNFGDPSGIYIDTNDTIYVTDSTSRDIVNRGVRIASTTDGNVRTFIPDRDPTASQEGVTADSTGNIYGSSTRSRSLQKYSLSN